MEPSTMENDLLQRIASACVGDNAHDCASFYAEHELAPADVQIDVVGVGTVAFPLDQKILEKLLAASSKAKFGLRDKTILDENVRNTQEIPLENLRVTINENAVAPMLTAMRDTLGLAHDVMLVPHLHNMLIYGPGQFFQRHQDSEKLDRMIATLVLVLPSAHIGGDLVIEHNGKEHVFSSENINRTTIRCVAFYADCHHRIEKIAQGHRIALTYNLVLQGGARASETTASSQLKKAITEYFDKTQASSKDPTKLAYFLDHSYTEHSLRWHMLKGTDRTNAAAFQAAAKELGFVAYLALVEVQETWDVEGNEDDPQPSYLIDDRTTLDYWIDADNQQVPFGTCHVPSKEICWTKGTREFEPVDSEHEGYKGNYGNTLDFWYRRAAVVLWRASDHTRMTCDLNYGNALSALFALTESPGNEKQVAEIIRACGSSLYERYRGQDEKNKEAFVTFTKIGRYLKDPAMALLLLAHFGWETLDANVVEPLIQLQSLYGADWCLDLLKSWHKKACTDHREKVILSRIRTIIRTFLDHGGESKLVAFLLDAQSDALIVRDDYVRDRTSLGIMTFKKALSERVAGIMDMLGACVAMPPGKVLNNVIQHLMAHPGLYPEVLIAQTFLELHAEIPPSHRAYFKPLQDHLLRNMRQELALGLRAENDWSIKTALPCSCERCKWVTDFLQSETTTQLVYALAKEGRDHVMERFRTLDLPVYLFEKKIGSPYKLVIEKRNTLHKHAKERFEELGVYVRALETLTL